MCCHSHEIMDVAAAMEQEQSLREQNKELLERLAVCVNCLAASIPPEGGYTHRVIEEINAVIAKAEARGGSRADGPLLINTAGEQGWDRFPCGCLYRCENGDISNFIYCSLHTAEEEADA